MEEKPLKRAFYDFSVAPFSYDFVSFLICARSNDCNQVVFVPGRRMYTDDSGNEVEYQKCTVEEQQRRLVNMLLPLCSDAIVCPDRESAKALWHEGCFPPNYTVETPTFSHMVGHVMAQQQIYPMRATDEIMEEVRQDVGENPIVIPMRKCPYRQIRNSNEPEWIAVAEWLIARGENVWFIPDTNEADQVYPVGKTYRKAAESVVHRLALASIAKLTIGVNSGNMVFAFFSKHPMLYFNPVVEGSAEASEDMWERNYVRVGSQPPWFTKQQRIVWGCVDNREDIIRTLETWYAVREGKAEWPEMVAPRFPLRGVVSNEERSEHIRVAMETGHPTLKHTKAFHDQRLSLVCYGPSLKKTWRSIKHPIMTVSGAHDFLIKRGIIPDYHVECDPREHKATMIHPHMKVKYLMASCMCPKTWDHLKGQDVTLWHLHNGNGSEAGIFKHDPQAELVGGGSTVGLRALEVASRLGFKKFDIYGMDCSCEGQVRHAGPHTGKAQPLLTLRVGNNPKIFTTSPQMKESAEEFMKLVTPRPVIHNGQRCLESLDIDIRMHGEGLLQTLFEATRKSEMVHG